jgi:hypothetical protein
VEDGTALGRGVWVGVPGTAGMVAVAAAEAAVAGKDVRERVGARISAPGAAELQAANSTTTAARRDLKAGCFKKPPPQYG